MGRMFLIVHLDRSFRGVRVFFFFCFVFVFVIQDNACLKKFKLLMKKWSLTYSDLLPNISLVGDQS